MIGPFRLRCMGTRRETDSAKTYFLARTDGGSISFLPGQFLNLTFQIDGQSHTRSYSISSSAGTSNLVSITVQKVTGGVVSDWLFDHFKLGCVVLASPPMGVFSAGQNPTNRLLFVTAGSGITPAASMLNTYADLGCKADIVNLHFAKDQGTMIFADQMQSWARRLVRCRVIPIITRTEPYDGWVGPTGRPTADLLRALVPDIAGRQVFCCGPAGFMDAVEGSVSMLGCSPDAFQTESFTPMVSTDDTALVEMVADGEGFGVVFRQSGKTTRTSGSVYLNKVAKAAQVHVQTSCREGKCGTCRLKLVSGTVEMRHQGGISIREIDEGYILACCSRPTSDLTIDA